MSLGGHSGSDHSVLSTLKVLLCLPRLCDKACAWLAGCEPCLSGVKENEKPHNFNVQEVQLGTAECRHLPFKEEALSSTPELM